MLCIVSSTYGQIYADSLIHFALVKHNKDTVKNESNLTWQDLHHLMVRTKLHYITAQYGVTHPRGIIYFEILCNTKTGWGIAGQTEIPFTLSASILTEPIGVYSCLKMKRVSGKVQVRVKKVVLYSPFEKSIELTFSDAKSTFFILSGADSTW
ncbi:MAG: hypothetical protein NZ455_00080 [Bacteroidia bacterium]|nr:hypothetical protein [Bacteroidia bacterium]MDW8348554.1 hypothetical protein [Bacteroidia bacterium]